MATLYQPPDEILISTLAQAFPCREPQIRALATLLLPTTSPCKNLVLYGTKSTGKSATAKALLATYVDEPTNGPLHYSIVNSIQCVTGRHLLERTLGAVADSLGHEEARRKCENLTQFTVELSSLLDNLKNTTGARFVLVFDGIDTQREAPPSLLPALARLPELIPSLTCVYIVTHPPAAFLRTEIEAYIHFPNYTKNEFVKILSSTPPAPISMTSQEETSELWTRFCGAVHDSLTKSASRTLPSFQHSCQSLWPRFVAPILAGTHTSREFSKLLIASRAHFQDETLLNPSIVSAPRPATTTTTTLEPRIQAKQTQSTSSDLATLLPIVARLLLLAAYLASHNASRHDLAVFSTFHNGKKKKRGGYTGSRGRSRSKHRKIARKLLGAHSFVMERMMAIFTAVRNEWAAGKGVGVSGLDGDVGLAIATLASLRLLVRVGLAADPMDRSARWRINVEWETVRAVGRSIGVEVEEWLVE